MTTHARERRVAGSFHAPLHDEVEIKLLVRPEDVGRLRSLAVFRQMAAGRARTQRLISVYYDTPDRMLRRGQVSLRVRRSGRDHVQGVKAGGVQGAGIVTRREWEGPVPTADPVVPAIGDAGLRRIVSAAARTGLAPVFRTEVKRTTRPLHVAGGARIEACINVGEIIADGIRQPLCELELELGEGEAHHLFDLALRLHQSVPLRLSTLSKATRGFALIGGETPGWTKYVGFELSAAATVEDALVGSLRHCLDHMLANQACALDGDHPEGVHQMRVALRRLRSVLRLFRRVLPAAHQAWLAGEVKWLARRLGPARDWDVFGDEIVAPVAAAIPEEPGFGGLDSLVRTRRGLGRRAARAALGSARYTRFLLETGAWLAKRGWRDRPVSEDAVQLFAPAVGFADAAIAGEHRAVRKRGRRFAGMSPAERHRFRIDVKRLRYAIDFFGSLYAAKGVTSYVAKLARLQDGLGYANDVALAEDMVARLCAGRDGDEAGARLRAGGMVVGWHAHVMARSQGRLAGDVRRLLSSKPFWR